MGYYSQVEGELRFSEPLTKGQLDDAMYAVKRDVTRSWIMEDAERVEAWTGDNDTTEFDSVRLEFEAKAYTLTDEVKAFVRAAATEGVTVSGEIEVIGEEQPDVWRLFVRDNRVTEEKARMVWPDGTEFRR